MLTQHNKKIAVNLISGTLGAGKTSLVRHLLNQKPKSENWVLLVNEFGSIGIDGAILAEKGNTDLVLMPGGCICCSAQTELHASLVKLTQHPALDRLIIEPTGLGSPDTILDLFLQPDLKPFFEIQTLFSVFDLSNIQVDDLCNMSIMQNLLSMADVVVLNKQDLATPDLCDAIYHYCQQIYPPKSHLLLTRNGDIPNNLFQSPHFHTTRYYKTAPHATPSPALVACVQPNPSQVITQTELAIPGLIDKQSNQGLDTVSIGYVFVESQVFEWQKVHSLFQKFATSPQVKRAKGIFRIGSAWMLFQYVNGQTTREMLAYRKDSRVEILLDAQLPYNLIEFEQNLIDAQVQSQL